MEGWIKLHRKLLDNSIFDNPQLLKLWMWCLLRANHKECKQMIGLQEIELKEGEFITGRYKGAAELKVNPSTFYKHLKLLESMQMIGLKSNSKMTIVTIENWGKYQIDEIETCQQNNNKITTKEQQNNTDKNVKNDKNVINIYSAVDNFSNNENLIQALRDFITMRKKIKAPMTDRAMTMLLNELDRLAATDDLKIKILEQSILNNWKSVYPLKKQTQQKPNKFHNADNVIAGKIAEIGEDNLAEKLKKKWGK